VSERRSTGGSSDRVRLAIVLAGLVFAFGAEWVRLAAGWSPAWVIADAVPGIGFLVCGSIAWARRPDTRIGPLMIATGFAWYVGTYGASNDPILGRIAYGFQGWYDALLAALVLAYPSGHLRQLGSRVVVAAFLGLLATRTVVRLIAYRVSTDYDMGDPTDIDRYVADQSFRDAADALFRVGIAAVAIAVLVLVAIRLRSETDIGRRVAGPILIGGVAFAIGIVVETAALASAGSFAERSFAWDLGQGLTVATASLVPIAFLVGLTDARRARGAVADLVVELRESPGPLVLRDVLARVLRDPTLQVAYAVDGTEGFVDGSGGPVTLPPPGDARRAVTRLDVGGRTIGALIHDPAVADQPELVRSVAAAAGLAIENERLAADVQAQLEEVRRSRARIVATGDAERRRIERDIHDGAQQRLVTSALTLQVARSDLGDSDPELGAMLARAAAELESALQELRQLARGLHPTVLVEEGLAAAIEALADRTPVPVTLRATERRFPPDVEATAYFVVAEAVTNVVKHARATSVSVLVEERDGILTVEIADDGVGGAHPAPESGLSGLDDRVAAARGTLRIRSEAGAGTTIQAEIPCA
jgi:signal transduction histidine kinase